MATLIQILSRKWPDADFFINGDDYSTLQWFSEGEPPSEAEIRAFSGEVDLEFARFRMRVTPLQFRMALYDAGLLDECEAIVADPATPKAARLAWEYAITIERNNPFIDQFATVLGLTHEQVDAVFEAAAQIQ
jgi:hypothetical protein